MKWTYIVGMTGFVIFACLYLKASYAEASINARKLGTLILLVNLSGAGYSILQESAELYTAPLAFFGTSLLSGTSMYLFDWFIAKRATNSDCAS